MTQLLREMSACSLQGLASQYSGAAAQLEQVYGGLPRELPCAGDAVALAAGVLRRCELRCLRAAARAQEKAEAEQRANEAKTVVMNPPDALGPMAVPPEDLVKYRGATRLTSAPLSTPGAVNPHVARGPQ